MSDIEGLVVGATGQSDGSIDCSDGGKPTTDLAILEVLKQAISTGSAGTALSATEGQKIMSGEWVMWVVIGLGFMPWLVKRAEVATKVDRPRRRSRRKVVTWEVRALFWSLTVRRRDRDGASWRFTAPLIPRLSDAVWAALRKLVG